MSQQQGNSPNPLTVGDLASTVEKPPASARHFWLIRPMSFEMIERCVKRITPPDEWGGAWAPFFWGTAVTAALSLALVRYTVASHAKPYSTFQTALTLTVVFAIAVALVARRADRSEKTNFAKEVQTLREEVAEAKKHVREWDEPTP